METIRAIVNKYKEIVLGAVIVYVVLDIMIKPLMNKFASIIKIFCVFMKDVIRKSRGKYNFNELCDIEKKIEKGQKVSKREKAIYEKRVQKLKSKKHLTGFHINHIEFHQ